MLPETGPYTVYDAWENRIIGVYEGQKVPIRLDPSESCVIFKGDLADEADKIRIREDENFFSKAKTEDWSGGFERSICKSIDYPAFSDPKLISVPDTLGEEEPKFSGFVRYEKELFIDTESVIPRTVLGITDAREGVEVFVNDRSLGIRIIPEYRFDLTPYLKPGAHNIRIEVATTLEREAQDFPSRYKAMGMQFPPVTTPSGINGKVFLLR